MQLDLWLGDRLVARTVGVARGARVRIAYDDSVLADHPAETPLLSCSLPVPGPGEPARSRAFLEGLLPEGSALAAAAAATRGVRLSDGSPESASDVVALLAEYGRECAGAVVALPAGSPPPGPGSYEPLSDPALGAIVHALPEHPLGSDLDRDIRMSLAGAQPKFLLARIDGRWHEPVGGAPSTHIVKPTGAWGHSAQNEALVLGLARACGLTDTDAWTEQMGGATVLVAERYDRRVDNGTVQRLHQEDMCQAVGLRPREKYAIGRPSERMSRLLREFADDPYPQTLRLFRQLVFRAVVGDEDGHGKNYSLLLDPEGRGVTLAPLYDSLCTLLYPELSGRMATRVGPQQSLAKVDAAALHDEGSAMGLRKSDVVLAVEQLTADLQDAIGSLPASLTTGWPSDRVLAIITGRLARLEQGLALGDARRRTSGPAGPTLDAATAGRSSR